MLRYCGCALLSDVTGHIHLYTYASPVSFITYAGIATGVGRAFSRVCLFVCLFVRTLTRKRLELSSWYTYTL